MFKRQIFSVAVDVLFIGVLVASLSGVGLAQAPGGQKMHRIAKLKTYLALTDKQVSDIQDLVKKHQTAASPIRLDLRTKRQEMRTAFGNTEQNPAAVGQIVIAQRSLRSQLRTLNLKLRDDIAAKLTPEQQEKFGQLKSRIGKRARRG